MNIEIALLKWSAIGIHGNSSKATQMMSIRNASIFWYLYSSKSICVRRLNRFLTIFACK